MADLAKQWMHMRRATKDGFPSIGGHTFFAPFSQMVAADGFTAEQFNYSMTSGTPNEIAMLQGLVAHEATHWADLVGTLWGRRHLQTIYRGLELAELAPAELSKDEVELLQKIDIENRRLKLPGQTVILYGYQGQSPAIWTNSIATAVGPDHFGKPSADHPILVLRFHAGEDILGDAPLSMASLLETTAFAAQYVRYRRHALDHGLKDSDELEEGLTELARRLYHPNHAAFAAPFHFCSSFGLIDALEVAIEVSAFIALVCLNLDDSYFPALIPPVFMDAMSVEIPKFKANKDPAFAFAVIAGNLPQRDLIVDIAEWIDEAMVKSGLPKAAEVFASALIELDKAPASTKDCVVGAWERHLAKLGADAMRQRVDSYKFGDLNDLNFTARPPVVDRNGALLDLPGTITNKGLIDPIDLIALEVRLSEQIRRAAHMRLN